ncbi:Zinc finger protein 318, partial [Araneus ventricosus]
MSHLPPRGILRKTNRQATSQSVSSYGPDEVYSHERNRSYRSDPANMPIFSEDEDIIQRINSKPQNINANLYAQALAAKSSLGLLDVGKSSALEALRSYDSHIDSPLTSPEKKQNLNPRSSQLSRSSFQETSGHHPSFYNDLEEEDLSPYKYTGTSRNSDPDHPVSFKPITDLNLNSVDDEDEFLYGDSNPLPSENSSFQNETTHKIRSNEAYDSVDLLDVETPGFDKYQKSLSFSKSKESNDDGKSGINLSISTIKKRSSWNYIDDPIADNRFAKQELSLTSKQYKESFDAYSNSPSALNEGSYEPHSYLHYNLDNQSRPSIPFKTSKECSLNFSELDPSASKISDSSLNQSVSAEDRSKNYEAAANLLRKQLNLDKSAKNNIPYEEEFYSKYNELPQNERRVIYDSEKKSVDKSSSGEPLKFPKLLINVQQGDSSPSKRVVQVKGSSISSSKYNVNHTKSESSLMPTHSLNKNEDLEVDKNVYEPDDLGTRRVVRDKTKVSREPVNVSSKGETRVLPKRYIEKSHKKNEESSMKQKPGEKDPKKYSDKYHFVKEGMESYYGYGSKSKSYKARSPERRWSPDYSPRRRSPSYSPRRWSPEYHRRNSPSYSPPSSHSHNRSPSYRYRDHSPSYRSRDSRRRSPERSSRRERRSHERSPHGHSRYRSRGRSPSWPVAEKESQLSQDGSSMPNLESKKKERTVLKRGRNFTSEEKSDDEQRCSVAELSDKLKGKEPSKILKVSESIKSDAIFSKKRKLSIPDENKEDIFQKSQHPDAVTKIIRGLGITKTISDPFAQNEKVSEITQDSPDSKEKRSEVMNSLLNKLGISTSTSTITTTVAPATSWTAGSTDSQASVSATPQQLNVNQYGMHYPQQLSSPMPQMYPQQYMYRASVPPVSHFPPFNTPPPLYPQPIPSTSAFSYPPPVPPVPNTFSSINFQINPRATNPNSKGRISCLKSIPVVNSNQSMPQPSVVWTQNNPSSPTKHKTPDASNALVKGVLPKNLSAVSPETSNSSAETEQNMVEKYKKLLEEKETLQKKLKNTSDHIIEIRTLQTELEKTVKLPKSSATKQLNIKCSNLYDRTNEELKRYIDEAKRVSGHVKELQIKIKPETLDKIAKEVPEKKVSSSVRYAGYDAGNHWCESCNQHISTIPKMMEHLHSETHIKHVDPSKVITKEPPKESFDKNVRLWPAKGVEFVKPLYAFYCSLCNEILSNQSYAEYHLKGSSHIEKYMTFLNENPVYERKREIFKEAAIVALANEKKQKDLEEIRLAKQLFKEKIEIKRQKKQDAIKVISDKLQQLKEKDKVSDELEESNLNSRMSPQNQITCLKLTLINEKSKAIEPLEPAVTKGPEVKFKPKVVYIGRAPNYKPRPKGTEKKSSTPSESKNTDSYVKDEEGKNSNTSSKDEHTAPNFTTLPTDEKIKNSKKLAGSTQSHRKNQIESPKKIKNIPGCQSEAEAKESEKVGCDSNKQSVESSDMPTDNSEINEAIKNFIRSRKNATPTKVDDNLSGMKTPEMPSKIPSPVSKSSPEKSSAFSESSPKVSSPLSKSSPKASSPLPKSIPNVSSPLVSSPLVSSPLVSSPLLREQPMSEEEKDFLILGICKSDMEPLAVPRPPPSNLIHNHSDTVSKFQSFPPPVQIPPPNMISKVPPPNITSQVPPPNIISQVPPPNIISQVPPPNITSQVPPPTLILQWSSEQKQQSSSVLSNVPLSNNNIPSISEQFSRTSAVDENTGVMDMEIDNDLVCSEIKVGSDVSSTEKELSVLGEPVKNELAPSSLSAGELCAKSSVHQVMDSDVVIKEDDDRLLLKNFLSSLMDSVSEKVGKDSKDGKNSIESISENLLLSSNKTTESNEKSSDHKFSLNPSSFEQSVSFPQSKNNEENSSIEKNEKDTQRYEQLVTVSSEIAVQYDNDDKMHINDPLSKDMIQNVSKENNSKSFQEMEIIVIKEEKNLNLTSTSKTTEEFHDVKEVEKPVTNSCHSFETETFLEQKNNVLV